MDRNNTAIEFDEKENKATITYNTDKGKVKISFHQDWSRSSDMDSSSDTCYLVADIQAKSKFGFRYKEIASAHKEVYYSWSDGYHNDGGSRGSADFFKNLETTKINHENPEITKVIARAQKDIVDSIPLEKERRRQLKEQEKQKKIMEEQQKENAIRAKENNFIKTFSGFIGRNR